MPMSHLLGLGLCRAAPWARLGILRLPLVSASRARALCAKPLPPAAASPAEGAGEQGAKPAAGGAAAAAPLPPIADAVSTTGAARERAPGGLAVYNEDDENLPPLKFEEGAVGAAQKGGSAIIIIFGAVAFGACVWGISQALFPGASSTQVIFNEALERVQLDSSVGGALGTPLKAYGADRGGDRGRRNAFERWETEEEGVPVVTVRFNVAGPNGTGTVVAQVPRGRKRGEFRYIMFEHRRKLVTVLDARVAPAPPAPPAPPTANAGTGGAAEASPTA